MIRRLTLALLPVAALAGCQQPAPEGNATTNAAAAAPSPTATVAATAPEGRDWSTVVTRTAETGYRMGNPAAPVQLVEFGSRTCPHCAAFAASGMKPLVENYVRTGKVSYEFRDWLRDGGDVSAALIGRCKGAEGFFPLLAAEFAYQPQIFAKEASQTKAMAAAVDKAPETEQPYVLAGQIGYLDFAKAQGISDAEAHKCLADIPTVEAIGKMNVRAKADYKLDGTPTFLVNGAKIDAVGWPEVEADLKAALAKAGA
ncbi:MAG TPA: thioredoxin domain-containing protein [Sphingomonas sp.]|nr:thioredoxin domain-containing protein [Sphingomonas sp.]